DCINRIIHKYPVVVFSKPSCPYCRKALEALSLAGISQNEKSEHNDSVLHVIDLSQHSNTQEIQRTLQTMTGRRTVPNVFVGGTSIGGGDETSKFQRNGQLVPLLEKAGA
ncbi:glutaredoxin, partial [Fragilariopsis cylindrus CCMP1102]